ncbi:GNAT family N-acetyltransferase [Defluviimonas sp. WL0050]|uniref:GNAT family N-acetyltransferase n=1 Tax=Albidovulum litorale TaxID=2984134 RepID=A0ABT2ZR49_9RHOB|nr:N-acetyltransferase [Defluviimonas sp. WL0050]MCV2873639.1 GNAT family N-acetyltransferase [Defluviimonas sp. WL0050]
MAVGITIRLAEAADAVRLSAALRALSDDLGDRHGATDADIAAAGFGPDPAFRAVIAMRGDVVVGAAVFSPIYSTTRASAGVFVSDLWVAPSVRGARLGPRLLAAVRDDAAARAGCGFIRLAVYADNPRAVAFYERMGFEARSGEVGMIIADAALGDIGGTA